MNDITNKILSRVQHAAKEQFGADIISQHAKCAIRPDSLEAIGHNDVGKGAMALLEAIGDVKSALANIELCITRDSVRSKDHAPESICQVWILIPQQVY